MKHAIKRSRQGNDEERTPVQRMWLTEDTDRIYRM